MPNKKVFAFCNQKGGVGKTTSVVNIAAILASKGFKTLILDLDPQANATSGLGLEKPPIQFTTYQILLDHDNPRDLIRPTDYPDLFMVPSNADLSGAELELIQRENREFSLRKKLEDNNLSEYDFIFLDCPPSLGMITINALTASDYLIIPLQCEYYALEGLGQLIHTFQLVKQNLNSDLEIGGVLLTMADFRTNLTQQVIEEVKQHFQGKVFESIIPRSVKVSEAPSFGKPAVIYDPHNRASKGYVAAAQEFANKFSQRGGAPKDPSVFSETTQTKIDSPQTEPSADSIQN